MRTHRIDGRVKETLLPEPEQAEWGGSFLPLARLTSIAHLSQEDSALRIASYLAEEIGRSCFPCPALPVSAAPVPPESAAILLALDEAEDRLGEEGYLLSVRPDGIRLVARRAAGLFYGAQSLLQLVSDSRDRGGSPALRTAEVLDRPRFRWRGMHLDVSRHFFPVDRILRFVDLLARHKMNRFHWHLTDDQGWRIEVPGFPRLTEIGGWRTEEDGTRHGGFYTEEDIRQVISFAASRFVTVVPEIELPGHAMAALAAYPELSCTGGPFAVPRSWGIFEDVFCAGKESTFDFLAQVLNQVARVFPGPYVHIGGDECPRSRWKQCPDCRRRLEAEGLARPAQLQEYFIRRIAALPSMQDRRLVGWDEILEGGAPAGTVVMAWRGASAGHAALRAGHEVILCPTTHCYFDSYQGSREREPRAFPRDVSLERVYSFEPVPSELSQTEAARILGGQGNLWTEHIERWRHLEYMAFPRLCALAEVLWSQGRKNDFGRFRTRLESHLERLNEIGVCYRPEPGDPQSPAARQTSSRVTQPFDGSA